MKTMIVRLVKAALPLTILALAIYIVLAATIAPPFTTLVGFDQKLARSRATDVLAVMTIGLPLAIGFVIFLHERVLRKDGKELPKRLKRIGTFCNLVPLVGIPLLAVIFGVKAIVARGNPVWHFWAGQAVGMLGIILLIGLAVLWKLNAMIRTKN